MTFPPPVEFRAMGLLFSTEMLFSTRHADDPAPTTMP
jgi:hypothetical protein